MDSEEVKFTTNISILIRLYYVSAKECNSGHRSMIGQASLMLMSNYVKSQWLRIVSSVV